MRFHLAKEAAHRRPPTPKGVPIMALPRNLGSIKAIAEEKEVSERTVRRWISSGLVTGFRMGPRLIRIDRDEVDAMLRQIPAAKAAS